MKLYILLPIFLLLIPLVLAVDDTIFHFIADEVAGTVLESSSSPQLNGTVNNALIWNALGKINGAIYPNQLYQGNFTTGQVCTEWTLAMWFKMDNFLNSQRFMSRTGNNNWNILGQVDGTSIGTYFGVGVDTWTFAFNTGSYNHLIITNDANNNVTMYLNNTISSTGWIQGVGQPIPNEEIMIATAFDRPAPPANIFDGFMDDIRVYCEVISASERTRIFNAGAGDQSEGVTLTSSLDVFVRNVSEIEKTLFIEDEMFNVYWNWSNDTDSSPLRDEDGDCNVTLQGGLFVDQYTDFTGNFSLCQAGCDEDNLTVQFETDGNESYVQDIVEVSICHNLASVEDLSVQMSCNGSSELKTIPAGAIPSCDSSFMSEFVSFSICNISQQNISISLSNDAEGIALAHIIDKFETHREFRNHTTESFYNATSMLWRTNHSHEYISHGVKQIDVSCNHTESNFDITSSANITIVNIVPQITIDNVNTDLGLSTLSDLVVIEYADGIWDWGLSVTDDDLDTVNYTFFDSTGAILQTNVSNVALTIQTFNQTFFDFDNVPFNLTIIANDTQGNITQLSIQFNVNDTANPVCVDFSNASVVVNDTFDWNVNCTDENFFSLNVSCLGAENFSFFLDGLNTPQFSFINSTQVTENITCEIEYCDGHTLTALDQMLITDKGSMTKRTFDQKITVESNKLFNDFKTVLEGDRYTFEIFMKIQQSNITFTITSDDHIFIMGDPDYAGWIITGEYWIDFETDNYKLVRTDRLDSNTVEVFIQFRIPTNYVKFHSIGKLNCISDSQTLSAIVAPVIAGGSFFNISTCPLSQDLPFVVGWFMVVGFLFLMVLFNELFFKIPIFNMITGVAFFFVSLSVFACSTQLGAVFTLFGFILIMTELIRFNKHPVADRV